MMTSSNDMPRAAGRTMDVLARRSLVIICIVYLVAGTLHGGWFLFTDYMDLRESLAAAAQAMEMGATDATEAAFEAAKANAHRGLGRLAGYGAGMLVVAYMLAFHRKRLRTKQEIGGAFTIMVWVLGAALLASRLVLVPAVPVEGIFDNPVVLGIFDLLVLHVLACSIMPWSVKESLLPFIPLVVLWGLAFVAVPGVSDEPALDRTVFAMMSPIVLVPGALIAGWRERRRDEEAERQFLGEKVATMGDELSRARIVHDAMFPDTFSNGNISFDYAYEPIHEIGGDYVHVHECDETGAVTVTLLDVAGHGLAAALTVNRLFGELERIRAENAQAEPGEVMALLNRYIYLTMARHSLYATGACIMLDPRTGSLRWVNAGHPPALVRRRSGAVDALNTTTFILGAVEPGAFDPEQQEMTLETGEAVIAYTDGLFEARDRHGRQFGLDRVRETACFDPPPRSWPRFLSNAVQKHHDGNADDDVLIAALLLHKLRIAEGAWAGSAKAEAEPEAGDDGREAEDQERILESSGSFSL